MHLLYITFGKAITNHIQAAFSICSFLTQPKQPASINVITDEPSFYKQLGSKITVIPVDEKKLDEWKGPHQFLWRIKIKAIAEICSSHPNEPVVYLDTDTFLYRNTDELIATLSEDRALMHEKEGPLSQARSKTEKKMWAQVKNKSFAGIKILATSAMWNAGLVATPNTKNTTDLQLAVKICDDMCAAGVTKRLIEQFALSIALDHIYGLVPARDSVAHYWSNKEAWNIFIAHFFMQSYLQNLSPEQTIEALKETDFSMVPVVRKTTNTNQRLQTGINRIFPARDVFSITNQLK